MKQRRRVRRLSDAADYDRTADRPNPSQVEQSADCDGDRVVQLDDGITPESPELDDLARYREERPPHYGD